MKNKLLTILLAGTLAFAATVPALAEETTEPATEAGVQANDVIGDEELTESLSEEESEAAEEEEPSFIKLSVDGVNEDTYIGYWEDFEPGFSLFLPLDWENPEISPEDQEKGIFFQSAATDSAAIVSVQANAAGSADIVEIAESMKESGFTSVQLFDVNGIYAVGYDDTANDLSGLSFLGESGIMYTILVTPVSVLEYQPIFLNVFQSLSLTEE